MTLVIGILLLFKLLMLDISSLFLPVPNIPEFRNVQFASKHFFNFPGATCHSIDIAIDKHKRIFLGSSETNMANLPLEIKLLKQKNRKSWVTLKIDRDASYGRVIELVKMLRNLGWERVSLVITGAGEPIFHRCE
jgi:biopolymer transport protein ExbD